MNILKWIVERSRSRPAPASNPARRMVRASIETLERRVLLDGTVGSQVFDAPGYDNQNESATIAFSPPGSSSKTVVTAYNDFSMQQFQMGGNGFPTHNTGWSVSNNGGSTFSRSSNDPNNPPVLPYTSSTDSYGDAGDPVLAYDAQNGAVYLATVGSSPYGEINVYRSSDYGKTFTSVMDATAGTPGVQDQTSYDKPWITVDNYPGDPGFGTIYLAYTFFTANGGRDIVVTSLAPGATTWPQALNTGDPPGVVIATGPNDNGPAGPQVLVAPANDSAPASIYVIYVAPDANGNLEIYAKHSSNPTSSNGWGDSIPLQTLNDTSMDINLQTPNPNGGYQETLTRVDPFPSAVINPVNSNHAYVGYTDTNADGVTTGVHVLDWNLTSNSVQENQVGQMSQVNDDWQPALAVSPTGSRLFVGFYAGNGVYVPPDDTSQDGYESYNTFAVMSGIDTSGALTGFGTTQQLSNVDNGVATGTWFSSARKGFLGDYDTASADIDNFYFGFSATTPETFGDGSTDNVQTDIHMATVSYDASRPPVPLNPAFHPGDANNPPTISWENLNDYGSGVAVYVEYSSPTQGWFFKGQGSLGDTGSVDISSLALDPNTTYYFRLFAQSPDNGPFHGPTSSYTLVTPLMTAAPENTVISGNHIALTLDPDGSRIDATVDGRVWPPMPFSTNQTLELSGLGASTDTISIDSRVLRGTSSTISDTNGREAVTMIGTSASDSVNLSDTSISFGTSGPSIALANTGSIAYADGGGDDSITAGGAIPKLFNPGAGSFSLNVTSGTLTIPSGNGTLTSTGQHQINAASLTIDSGAKVVLATSSATLGDYSNHANRSVLVIADGGISIASGGTLDMGDNDLILRYASADETAAVAQLRAYFVAGFDGASWDTPGIDSSESTYDANFGAGTRALGYADNNDLGYSSFDGVDTSDGNEVLAKFTYYGDSDLNGIINGTDFSLFGAGRSGAGTGWDFGDYDYSGGRPNGTDFSLFGAGLSSYRQFGAL